jgi:hypothetical protein
MNDIGIDASAPTFYLWLVAWNLLIFQVLLANLLISLSPKELLSRDPISMSRRCSEKEIPRALKVSLRERET